MILIFQLLTVSAIIFIIAGVLLRNTWLCVIGVVKILITVIFGGLLG